MELLEAMRARHSVRSYSDRSIDDAIAKELHAYIALCNQESGLHMQLILNEPKAFGGTMAHYGNFTSVQNYIAIVGKKHLPVEEQCGYYGQKVVLKAQQLGLNTCWVALTFNKIKHAFAVKHGEKLYLVIAIGYGTTNGESRKSKKREDVGHGSTNMPDWFWNGIDAALLAPTAMNQQKFIFTLEGNEVHAKAGMGFWTKVDLGIAKYHFELGAGITNFQWKDDPY